MQIRSAVVVSLLLTGTAGPLLGQRRVWPTPPPTSGIEEVAITGIAAASTALVALSDARVRAWAIADPTTHLPIRKLDALFRPMGEHIPLYLSGGAALVGLVSGADELRDGALSTGESILAAMAVKGVLQRVAGRLRPDAEPHDPGEWKLFGGFGDREHRSFPSGHAANAFAFATGVLEELHHIDSGTYPWAAGVLYTAATATSASRVIDDEHWLSDVIAGMALGALSGAIVSDLNGR